MSVKHQCTMCNLASKFERGNRADLSRIVKVFLADVTTLLGVDAADVLIYDASAQTFNYAGGRGFNTRAFETSNLRITLANQIVRERKIVRNADLRKMKNEWARSHEVSAEGMVAYLGLPLIVNGQLCGVLELFHREHLNPNAEWLGVMEDIAEHGAYAIANALTLRQLHESCNDMRAAYDSLIGGWARALELRDYEPQGHTQRVTEMTVDFARALGVPETELVHVRRGAMLHDVGKMGTPDSILLKVGPLDDEEWKVIRQHPVIAFEQLGRIEFLRPALVIPYCHHEMWDGKGYPRGLAGEQIPYVARIFAVVDVWDSLSSDRPYRKAWPPDKVRAHIRDRGGKHFDQRLADTFVKLLESGEGWRKKPGANQEGMSGSYDAISFRT